MNDDFGAPEVGATVLLLILIATIFFVIFFLKS